MKFWKALAWKKQLKKKSKTEGKFDRNTFGFALPLYRFGQVLLKHLSPFFFIKTKQHLFAIGHNGALHQQAIRGQNIE